MPVVGEFHGKFWRARANIPPPPGAGNIWMYPCWQISVVAMTIFGPPLDLIRVYWRHVLACIHVAQLLWRYRVWVMLFDGWDAEQRAVVNRAIAVMNHPTWTEARQRVRACAETPKFHQPEQWLAYSRAVKANAGHAQNIWRHVRVVLELKAADPTLTNPDAHLIAELAYQGFAAIGRPHELVTQTRIA